MRRNRLTTELTEPTKIPKDPPLCSSWSLWLIPILLLWTLGGCPGKTKAPTKAKAVAKKKAPMAPNTGPLAQKILYEQGKSLLRAGRPIRAEKAFRRAIAAHHKGPQLANSWLGLGSVLGEQGRHKEAVKAYEKVVELQPTEPEAYRALAIGHEDTGDLKKARQALEQALALDGDQLSAYQDLATLCLKQKDIEAAKKIYLRYELRRTALIRVLGLVKDVDRRVNAALALGDARDEATVKALGLALTDSSRAVRLAVIRALGRQGLSAGAGPLKALLAKTADGEVKREIQISLKAIAAAAQPKTQPAPQPVPAEEKAEEKAAPTPKVVPESAGGGEKKQGAEKK